MKNINDLIEKDGLYYEKDSDTPFNGDVIGSVTGKFNNGKPEGKWIEYYENGQLKEEPSYKNRKKHGTWEFYYETGQLQAREKYNEGKPIGVWKTFSAKGRLIEEKDFSNMNRGRLNSRGNPYGASQGIK